MNEIQLKAKELFDRYDNYPLTYEWKKQCALITVDELLIQNGELYLNGLDGAYYREKNNFLFEVKQEIKKL